MRGTSVDTSGLLLTVLVTAASVQDRDAAKPLLWNLRYAFPQIRLAWADGGYGASGDKDRGPSDSRADCAIRPGGC